MSRAHIQSSFPRLKQSTYFITSRATPNYNCIAWAADDDTQYWWPDSMSLYYWPKGIDRTEDLDAFSSAFATLGYEPCDAANQEEGFEKIAIFADARGKPLHAARQLPNGAWTSKLGSAEDIQHALFTLEGKSYGMVQRFMRRPISGP